MPAESVERQQQNDKTIKPEIKYNLTPQQPMAKASSVCRNDENFSFLQAGEDESLFNQ